MKLVSTKQMEVSETNLHVTYHWNLLQTFQITLKKTIP